MYRQRHHFSLKQLLWFLAIILLLVSPPLYSQSDSTGNLNVLYQMSLEELMDVEVTIASNVAMTQRESPGVISVVTAEEIQNSGASDLEDVLRLVPGFEFVVDVTAATGISLRGNLGYIGRVLIMLDGQELNELLYACTFTGNHYPVRNIERIEIIRGPGSSIYGGFAELGVINIITKKGSDINGVEFGLDYGQMSETYSQNNILLSVGKGNTDYDLALHAFYGRGNRSEKDNFDIYGNSFNMAGQSAINPLLINASVKFRGLSTRFVYDKYVTTSRDYFGVNLNNAYQIDYTSILGEIKYAWRLRENLTLTPKINFVNSVPWHSVEPPFTEDENDLMHFDKSALRRKFNLTGSYNRSGNIFTAGFEYYQDNASHTKGFTHNTFWNGQKEIQYSNLSGFAQGILMSDFVNITLGARVDKHSQYGAAFAPRVNLTRVFNKFHLKLLYSQAFRSPSIDEIDLNYYLPSSKSEPQISPEKAMVHEFELGYMIGPDMSIIGNFFRNKIDNSILFLVNEEGGEGYDNSGTSGSNGVELEYRLRKLWGYMTLNYSFYVSSSSLSGVNYYAAGNNDNVLLGTAPHKVALNGSYIVSRGLTVNPSFTYLSERYAYTYYDDINGEMVLTALDPLVLANLYFQYKNGFTKGLTVGLGLYNILDANYKFIQPYNGSHPPLPGQSRRVVLKLSYHMNSDR